MGLPIWNFNIEDLVGELKRNHKYKSLSVKKDVYIGDNGEEEWDLMVVGDEWTYPAEKGKGAFTAVVAMFGDEEDVDSEVIKLRDELKESGLDVR